MTLPDGQRYVVTVPFGSVTTRVIPVGSVKSPFSYTSAVMFTVSPTIGSLIYDLVTPTLMLPEGTTAAEIVPSTFVITPTSIPVAAPAAATISPAGVVDTPGTIIVAATSTPGTMIPVGGMTGT